MMVVPQHHYASSFPLALPTTPSSPPVGLVAPEPGQPQVQDPNIQLLQEAPVIPQSIAVTKTGEEGLAAGQPEVHNALNSSFDSSLQ